MYERYCEKNIEKGREDRRKQRSRKRQTEKKQEARRNLVKLQAVVRGYLTRKMILFEGKLPQKHEITKLTLEEGTATRAKDKKRERKRRQKNARMERQRRDASGYLCSLRPTELIALVKIQRIVRSFIARQRTRVRFGSQDLIEDGNIFVLGTLCHRRYKVADSGQKWRQQQLDQQRDRGSSFKPTKWQHWKVQFMWTERVYDEAGSCQIRYSKSSNMPRADKVYFKETRQGGILERAQIESHWQFMRARAAHQALLRLVEDKVHRQRAQRRLKDIQNQKKQKNKSKVMKTVQHPGDHMQGSQEVLHKTPAIANPVEEVLTSPSMIRVTRIPREKGIHKKHKERHVGMTTLNTVQHQSKYDSVYQTTTRIQESSVQEPLDGGPCSYFHTSYLLASISQHHAWISPVHRKALRQQPFMI